MIGATNSHQTSIDLAQIKKKVDEERLQKTGSVRSLPVFLFASTSYDSTCFRCSSCKKGTVGWSHRPTNSSSMSTDFFTYSAGICGSLHDSTFLPLVSHPGSDEQISKNTDRAF